MVRTSLLLGAFREEDQRKGETCPRSCLVRRPIRDPFMLNHPFLSLISLLFVFHPAPKIKVG